MDADFSLEELKLKNFQGELENERDWRVNEFSVIKRLYLDIKAEGTDDELKSFTRMTIPIIYAHWEGFCVSSYKYVLRFINNENLNYTKLTNNLFTYANKNVYDRLKGKQSFEQRCQFSQEFLESLSTDRIQLDTRINTKSNLNFETFEEVCNIFEINIDLFKTFSGDLNRIVNVRNAIAHGENSFTFEIDQIVKYMELTINLMDTLLVEQFNFINEKKYMTAS